MTKAEALELIDNHNNQLLNPIEMLHWTWLLVIILGITDGAWEEYVDRATKVLSK